MGISTTAAYGFARLKFRFKGPILNSMLLLQMFPVAVALVAIYAIFEAIGQYVPWLGIETHAGLIVAYLGGVATHVWTIKGYFETIPAEIEECAKVDGASGRSSCLEGGRPGRLCEGGGCSFLGGRPAATRQARPTRRAARRMRVGAAGGVAEGNRPYGGGVFRFAEDRD